MINTEQDLISLFNLCKNFHEESKQGGKEEINYTKVAQIFNLAYSNPDKFFVDLKRDKDNQIVGMFIGYIQPLFYSTILEGMELFFYLRHDHRGSPWFVKTLKRFESWSAEKGATTIRLFPSSGVESNTTVQMYERLGYNVIGHILHKEI